MNDCCEFAVARVLAKLAYYQGVKEMFRFIDRYQFRSVLLTGGVLVWDFLEDRIVVMTMEMWQARKNFLVLEVDGKIVP